MGIVDQAVSVDVSDTDMEQLPLISVVIPIYKPDHLFEAALASVLNQTYRNIEIIISDDGESKLPESLIADSRVIYVRNNTAKHGIFPNLNHAISHAKGQYLQIFCQDDFMDSRFIEIQVRLLQKFNNYDFIFSNYEVVNNADPVKGEKPMPSSVNVYLHNSEKFINRLLVYGCMPGNLSPVMITRQLYNTIGPFDENFKYAGDFNYWIKSGAAFPVIYNNSKFIYIRNHNNQASKTLPRAEEIKEAAINYKLLLEGNTIKRSGRALRWYINEKVGVQEMYYVIKRALLKKELSYLSNLKLLNRYPFNLFTITLLFICSFRNKLNIIKINERDL